MDVAVSQHKIDAMLSLSLEKSDKQDCGYQKYAEFVLSKGRDITHKTRQAWYLNALQEPISSLVNASDKGEIGFKEAKGHKGYKKEQCIQGMLQDKLEAGCFGREVCAKFGALLDAFF